MGLEIGTVATIDEIVVARNVTQATAAATTIAP